MKKNISTLFATIILLIISQHSFADNRQGNSGRQGPPQEAFDACLGKSAGDSAQFEGRNGETISGICEERDGKLILQPSNMPSDHPTQANNSMPMQNNQSSTNSRQGPPAEAFTACEGKTAGDKSSFKTPNGESISGQCLEQNGQLVLVPDNLRR